MSWQLIEGRVWGLQFQSVRVHGGRAEEACAGAKLRPYISNHEPEAETDHPNGVF